MTAKEKYLQVYPDARAVEITPRRWLIAYGDDPEHPGYAILGIPFVSEEAAWQKAAESLPAQPGQEICKCGHGHWNKQGGCSCCPCKEYKPVESLPVEAKEKCGHCGRVLDGTIQRCSNDGFCSKEGQPEPKPTLSTPSPKLPAPAEEEKLEMCASFCGGHCCLAEPCEVCDRVNREVVEEKAAPSGESPDNYSEAADFAGITFDQACQFDLYMQYLLGRGPAPGRTLEQTIADRRPDSIPEQTFWEWLKRSSYSHWLNVYGHVRTEYETQASIAQTAWNAAKGQR